MRIYMETPKETPTELRKRGLNALAHALGPVGMIRFLQQFESGSEDYSRDREHWLKDAIVRDVAAQIRQRREKDG